MTMSNLHINHPDVTTTLKNTETTAVSVFSILPIWPSLHFGCATTLPPIQKNSSASLEMDALCQSFGELMMDGEGQFNGLELCLTWRKPPVVRDGENIPAERDPKDWKVVFFGDMGVKGWLLLSPGDKGAIAGVLFIPELSIEIQLSCPFHITSPPSPLCLLGSSAKCICLTGSLMQISECQHVFLFQISLPIWNQVTTFPS